MNFGSKFVYLGDTEEDYEDVKVSERDNCALSDSDCSDDDGETCMLDILDTAGQEEFSSMRDQYVRHGDGFVCIYSVSDRQSLSEAEALFSWLRRLRGGDGAAVPAVLVANKQDLAGGQHEQVSAQDGEDLARKLAVPLYKTSAKTGEGVEQALHGLVRLIPRTGMDYKIVMLGAGAVGKSSITVRFVSNTFISDYDPTIEDSFRKMINVSGLTAITKDRKKAQKKTKKMKRRGKATPTREQPSELFGSSERRVRPQSSGGGIVPRMLGRFGRMVGFGGRGGAQQQQQQQPQQVLMAESFEITSDLYGAQETVKSERQRKADGNVVLIPLRELVEEPKLVTGDPIKCQKCNAILASTANLEDDGEGKLWTCEFCGEANRNLDISEEEIPQGESFDYMLAPATKPEEEEGEAAAAPVETKTSPGVLVYCMDVSSSMSSLCRVPESHAAWREERTHGEESINDVSRLKCIQKAIERLAEQLKLEQPQKEVLLSVFSGNFVVKGGGRTDPLPSFDGLDRVSFEDLLEKGGILANEYPLKPIEESHEDIDNAVKALMPTGCTALGPALSICTGYVSKVPGSEIVLCTDGEPNTGVGSLNRSSASGAEFYSMIGNYARSKNITINILSMEGASTGLQHVSKAAENSGGTTTKLNPVEIVRQLRLIAQNETVATQVTVRFFLHPGFVFDEPDFPKDLSQLEKEVGSVKKETDLTFRFKLRDSARSLDMGSVPFQVQIEYTRPDGMQCLRVLSKKSESTRSRQAMEEAINVSVLGVSAMKTTAKMTQAGRANQAQHMVKNVKRLVTRGARDSQQKEERLAFQNELTEWDDHLTYNNARLQAGCFDDMDADMYVGAQSSNVMQQASSSGKMAFVSKRKMNKKSKEAYYAYKDTM